MWPVTRAYSVMPGTLAQQRLLHDRAALADLDRSVLGGESYEVAGFGSFCCG
jgi:hypothetical protein